MTLKEYTFSDGLVVPNATLLSVNTFSRHRSADHYPRPESFDGFRYAREGGQGQSLASGPALEYHAFGHGRSAWCVSHQGWAPVINVVKLTPIQSWPFFRDGRGQGDVGTSHHTL